MGFPALVLYTAHSVARSIIPLPPVSFLLFVGASIKSRASLSDPCHLGREQAITEEPRKLLVDSGGFELVEMAEANWCCGGAGSYNLSHPEMSHEILARKLSRIADTGAELVTTACPACLIQIASGVWSHGWQRPVRHLVELLADRQGV